MTSSLKLILASGSPRRRQLLAEAGLRFESIESGVEEIRAAQEAGREYALRMASAKAIAVSTRVPDALVLGADTIVECAGEILEKPHDADDVRRMLGMLSGRAHVVVTGFAIARAGELIEADAVESSVFFRPLSAAEINEYLATGEPFDKAGGYGIQGIGGGFISKVEGPRDNVMGLPVDNVLAALTRAGLDGKAN
ncbi:MAG: Maf family protein [Candidatus Binataceae bacterium]